MILGYKIAKVSVLIPSDLGRNHLTAKYSGTTMRSLNNVAGALAFGECKHKGKMEK